MKRAKKRATIAGVLIFVLGLVVAPVSAPEAADGSFLCENNFRVRLGQHATEVLWGCGDPDHIGQRTERRTIEYRTGRRCACHQEEIRESREIEILVDDWVYDFGVNHKARHLRFENGFLARIHSRWIASP
jgi:hypothetical protein